MSAMTPSTSTSTKKSRKAAPAPTPGMITKAELGRRIREIRTQRSMTLKEVQAASGFSATHISEIERGKTSPTIGALIKIARALGKDPGYFVEEEPLEEICYIPRESRARASADRLKIRAEFLTAGIPGGRLYGYLFTIEPGARKDALPFSHPGEEGGFVVRGSLEVTVGEESYQLGEGDAIHFQSSEPHAFRNTGKLPAELILVSTLKAKSAG